MAAIAADTEAHAPAPRRSRALIARVKAILADRGDSRLAQLVAGKVFLVRVASALLALVSQVLLARWMGASNSASTSMCGPGC